MAILPDGTRVQVSEAQEKAYAKKRNRLIGFAWHGTRQEAMRNIARTDEEIQKDLLEREWR